MSRYVSKKVVLSDGTVIPKNSLIMILDDGPQDASIYEHPEKFDAYRFLRKREQPGEKSRYQVCIFISESNDLRLTMYSLSLRLRTPWPLAMVNGLGEL